MIWFGIVIGLAIAAVIVALMVTAGDADAALRQREGDRP